MPVILAMLVAATLSSDVPRASSLPVPIGSSADWIRPSDYPPAAMVQGLNGVTAMHLRIDTQGRVAACAIDSSSGSELLDQTACALVKMRGTYQPALNGRGIPIAGDTVLRARWIMPNNTKGDFPVPIGAFALTVEADVQRDGRLTSCQAPTARGLPISGELLCAMLLKEMPVVKGTAGAKLLGPHVTLRMSMDLADIKAP